MVSAPDATGLRAGGSPVKSFDDRMEEVGGFGPGFDFVRIALALGVLAWHALAAVVGNAEAGKATVYWMIIYSILPMFFALSGFLVTGSALRLPLKQYILNRVFRIVPALGVDIMLSALILGPIFTAFSLAAYFNGREFWIYFLNIIGVVHYQLPGVFLDNPLHGIVNGSLWTVPYEIGCYVVMSLMIYSGVIRSAVVTSLLAIIWLVIACVLHATELKTGVQFVDKLFYFLFLKGGASLIAYFLGGSALFLAKARIPFDGRIAAVLGLALVAASSLLNGSFWWTQPVWQLLWLGPLVYLVIYCGMQPLPKVPVFDRGDYSYGVYLYHFPILQALQHMFGFANWLFLLAAAFVPVTVMAMFSWHNIEKPILKMRKRFSLVGARIASES